MIYAKKEILFTMEELKKRRNDRRREIPVVPRRTRFPKIIKLNEEIITPKDQMRYLGVILYKTKVYINHLNAIKGKVETVAAKMAGPKRRKYGNMARDTMKNVYDRVVKPAILYGFETWGRYALILINGAYKTAPTSALQVIAGVVPLPIEAEARAWPPGPPRLEQKYMYWPWEKPWRSNSLETEQNEIGRHIAKVWTDARKKQERVYSLAGETARRKRHASG
ncbi:hypothetical protein GWI33_000973 [Rhynchophorus ferrugineus]|uniref:Uncharacterized protein n=1 Tax=Rhynchophorus ferrugineus TaxID=354439 RepID=A0A834MLX7_RHYFE|nr:hypothetical protein GWI33_000973 [Rhynchophorus ferrugineus]